jgi:L-alanine-DL-glutamate epimerase-like enolase superfamily enzyme
VAVVAAAPRANGPEDRPRERDAPAGWNEISWREHEGQVRRLRQRIFKAAQEQDWPRVRNLQRLMLRSRANTLVSVRQVTQRNAGRNTAGIDGEVALTPEARAQMAGAPVCRVLGARRGQARVYPEGIKSREAQTARDSRAHGPLPPGPGP